MKVLMEGRVTVWHFVSRVQTLLLGMDQWGHSSSKLGLNTDFDGVRSRRTFSQNMMVTALIYHRMMQREMSYLP